MGASLLSESLRSAVPSDNRERDVLTLEMTLVGKGFGASPPPPPHLFSQVQSHSLWTEDALLNVSI